MLVKGEITYTKRRLIGTGFSSEVYLAHDPQLAGDIAVKEIPKTHFKGRVSEYFDEAKTMFSVAHRNIVPVMCAFQTSDTICLAMKHYRQGSLQDRCAANPLSTKEVLRVAQGILMGLSSIHARDYIHFDIKPSNILFSDRNTPMVADFGQTRARGPTGITPTPAMYIAGIPPECHAGVGSIHSDIYQTGLTLYRAVNGNAFFETQRPATEAETAALTLSGKFPRRDRFMPHVPKRIRTILRTALSVDPSARYQSASEFADALARVDVDLDWVVRTFPDGELSWRADRSGQPAILVELRKAGKRWDIQIHSEGATKRRWKKAEWKKGVTRVQALAHLKTLFDSLG